MAARNKGTVFRVTGLPALQPDDELKAALKAAIGDNLGEDEQSKSTPSIAIMPSCYDNDEKAALVEFYSGVPAFLSELMANPLGDWQVEMGDTDISFDQHFFGFTQLYTPKLNSPATADIIAITGLDGHAYGSWRGKGNLGRMWLRDFLSKDLPCCRTMIYGYNSKLSTHGVDTIMDYSRGLMEELKKVRNTEELRKRPLFFIAHSFGGIILAHCLVKAVQADEDDHPTIASLHKATYGMLLFGIPHKGLVVDDIQKMVAGEDNHPRSALLEQIRSKSDVLAFQLVDFRNLIRDRKVVSFYETGQTRQLEFDGVSRRWRRTGDFVTAVAADSALLQLPDSMEDKIPLNADHSIIVKFDNRNNQGYTSARDKLRQFEQDAPSVVASRFLQAKSGTSSERRGPLRVLPFGRNRDFVGRQSQLSQLVTILHTEDAEEDCPRAALVGLGGVGKTQIALECAFQLQSTPPTCSVFWVQASDATSFENAYRNIGQQLRISGLDDEKADVKNLVKARLSQESSGKWLMVVDNADDYEMFYNSSDSNGSHALSEYLPFSLLGSILFTTRDREAATRYAGSNVINIDEMDDSESRELLQRSLQNKQLIEDNDSIAALLKSLVNLPLAIMQAAAYLNAKGSTIAEYLRIYEESNDNVIKLLSKDFEDRRRYPGMKNPIATTWLISFKQIQVRDPLAAEYMAFISCVNEQDIPRDLLPPASKFDKTEALGTLKAFGFIKERCSAASYDMHRLVHIAMQNWLKLKGEWREWNERALSQITDAFPFPQHENRAVWMVYLPHAKSAIAAFKGSFGETRNLPWSLLRNLGETSRITGKYAEAATMHRQTLQLREAALGKDHPDTLRSMSDLSESLRLHGKYAEAEAMDRQTLQLREAVLGKDHLDTLRSMSDLAASLRYQGKYTEAEAMERQTLQLKEAVLGKDHPDMIRSINSIAASLQLQGKYAEAEVMYQQILQLHEAALGKDHPQTLRTMSNIAGSLRDQGKYVEAKEMDQQTLQLQEAVLGKDHPDTLRSMSYIAASLYQQGMHTEAEEMHQQTLQIQEAVLGKDHPDTLKSMSHIITSLHRQGKYAEAEAMLRQTLQLREAVLGKYHPDTLASMNNIAVLLHRQGKYAEAKAMHQQILQLQEAALGKDHPHTLASMINLAESLRQEGKHTEAEAMHQQTLQIQEVALGKDHPDTLASMSRIARSLQTQGKYVEAEAIGRQTLQLREAALGKDHPDTLSSISHITELLYCQGKYAEAEAMLWQALQLMEAVLGKDHPDTLGSMNNIVVSLLVQGKYVEAEAMGWQTLQLMEAALRKDHPHTLASMSNLAESLRQQGKYVEAEAMDQQRAL